ncbi:Squalestatin tetraketide synthase [Paramyrothecium foliicola]|nr:Squalestatin tetraketide synthase [Paramyrothecium foliicola]
MEPIAIIGMSFKFPGGAETGDSFWQMLAQKKCAATEYPKDRFNIDAFWHPDSKRQGIINAREGHFLSSDIKNFDAGFFSAAPHEVNAMDPQHRGLLETTYHAFENAGLRLPDVAGTKTSVHIGSFTTDFATMQVRDIQNIPKYHGVGAAGSMLANRLSWFYDLRGESMYIDTACSSSLNAMYLACQGLRSGVSDMAVVGGSNVILTPEFSVALSNMNFLSPSGRCRSFDASGDGYGRGEGFAVMILKPLSKAIADGDPIRSLVRSVGANQDGYTHGGITQPSRELQVQLIKDTYKQANLDMKHTRYFEAHGTGTAIGDPTEARAIGQAFFKHRSPRDPIYIGAVKSNIGHLEGSSGLAGVVKTVLVLERGVIPPNANFERLNPQIDAEFFNLHFPVRSIPWPSTAETRLASVNSFGFGGSNCHAVLEAAETYFHSRGHQLPRCLSLSKFRRPLINGNSHLNGEGTVTISTSNGVVMTKTNGTHGINGTNGTNGTTNGIHRHENGDVSHAGNHEKTASHGHTNGYTIDLPLKKRSTQSRLLILSASDENGISRQASILAGHLGMDLEMESEEQDIFDDILFTFNRRRTMLEWKSYAIIDSLSGFSGLEELISTPTRKLNTSPQLGLVFTGQGAQWPRMGYELLTWPIFRASLLRSQAELYKLGCKWRLGDELTADAESSRINDPEFSQTVTTAVQIALVELLKALKVEPAVVVGHSSGEIAAAYCAGYLSQESAVRVAYFRGLLASRLARESSKSFGMASIGLASEQLAPELHELEESNTGVFVPSMINISCINSPNNVTISGPVAALDLIVDHLSFKGVFARRLKVDLAYHSPQMDSISAEYLQAMENLRPGQRNTVKMISSVKPGVVGLETVCKGEYWVQNMVSPVCFLQAISFCHRNSSIEDVKLLDRSHLEFPMITHWVEVGPHAGLQGPLRETIASVSGGNFHYNSLLVRNRSAGHTFFEAAGNLYCRGFDVDLDQAARVSTDNAREPRIIMDLPQYPFNHSILYWEESSRSKEFRNRTQKHHPLVGSPVLDWTPLDARWRLTIRKDNLPWVSDHRVHGAMWYPAAGMLAMATEGLKQLLQDDQFDIEMHNITFAAPIIITEGPEGTETQISITPASKERGDEADYKFRILVKRPDETWDEVCDGTIIPRRMKITPLDVTGQDEEENKRRDAERAYNDAILICTNSIEASEMYAKTSETLGLQYGPSFQGITNIRYTDGQAHALVIPVGDATAESSRPFAVHPSTLDSIFQLALPALSRGLTDSLTTMVPSHVTRLWISREGAGGSSSNDSSEEEVAHVRAEHVGKRSAISHTTVFSKKTMKILIQVDGLEVTEAARKQDADDSQPPRAICHEMVWKPDLGLMDKTEIFEYCAKRRGTSQEPEEWYKKIDLLVLGYANQVFEKMEQAGEQPCPNMKKYAAWLRIRLDEHLSRSKLPLPAGSRLKDLATQMEQTGFKAMFVNMVGRQLQDILTGQVDPLELLFADSRKTSSFYEELNTHANAFPSLQAYLDLLVHRDPGLRFLEIGAGTGATSQIVLDVIARPEDGPRCAEYVFTDISKFFSSTMAERFERYDKVHYRTLDIETEIHSQEFEEGTYDVVVAANVLHATRDLSATLQNTRRLLKPGGKLILVEVTTPENSQSGFVWGTVPGWWLSCEDYRQTSPLITEDRWDLLLKQTGFSGTEHVFRDWETDLCHGWSIMISTATEAEAEMMIQEPTSTAMPEITLIIDDSKPKIQLQVAQELQRRLRPEDSQAEWRLITIEQAFSGREDLQGKHFFLLADLGAAHLHEPDLETLQVYQKIMTTSKSVLWVQSHDDQANSPPYWAMAEGLSRVCRNENPFVRIVTVTLETSSISSPQCVVDHIEKVLRALPLGQEVSLTDEVDWKEMSGKLSIGRLRQAKYLDLHISDRTKSKVQQRKFGSGAPIALDIRLPGLLDTLEWVEDGQAYVALGPDMVEVQIRAVGVNFKDALTVLGRVNASYLGGECAGYVSKVGEKVTRVRVGDRVAVANLGTYRSLLRLPETNVIKIPESISLEEAAGIITAFCTAYYSLITVARLKKGETILIHAAAGGTGQAAVQLAQHIGAEVYVTCGSASKKEFLVKTYGIREDHIFYSRNASFADGIRRMTKGRGVDVILNSLSGKLLVASWEIVAEFGRFIEIGRKDIDTRGSLPMFPFINNTSFAGVDLQAMVGGVGNDMLEVIFDMMERKILRPSSPLHLYPMEEADKAFRLIVSGKSTGKIVLKAEDDSMVPVKERDSTSYRFAEDATYVIAGGLGGIGRQIARWLVRRGARNVLLLARRGPESSPERMRTVEELKASAINLRCEVCDVSDREAVRRVLEDVQQTMPPIKGCFHAGMAIRDRPFASMGHQEWTEAVLPKVQGSWNLHSLLPSGMDFFLLLSSAVCIFGNPAQANYASGNTFQDELARYRIARGERAVAIDLGLILDEGWVAENKPIHDRVLKLGVHVSLSQRELFAIFDYYCNPGLTYESPVPGQVVTGLQVPSFMLRNGMSVPELMNRPMLRAMHQVDTADEISTAPTAKAQSFALIFEEATTLQAASEAVAEALKVKLCTMLGIEQEDKSINDRMDSFGMDSLIALEVRNWLAREMRADLAVHEILGDTRFIDTGLIVASKSEFRQSY